MVNGGVTLCIYRRNSGPGYEEKRDMFFYIHLQLSILQGLWVSLYIILNCIVLKFKSGTGPSLNGKKTPFVFCTMPLPVP